MENRFWMVFIEGRAGPTKQHIECNEARLEAERLLRLPNNRGRKAYILEAVSYGLIEEPPVVWSTFAMEAK
jgi:hypothetical protein